MPVPVPPVPLENVCSVIYDNFLYTYSSVAFLRLELKPGAEWEELPKGVSVTDGVCVGSTPNDASLAGLYIVGGAGPDDEYKGLQKFTYSTGEWESISPVSAVTQHRKWHAATYLNNSDSILIYGGNQDGNPNPSSQTFTIQAHAPYEVTSFESIAPPTISPLLMPWSETDAVLVGGDLNNRKVMLFNPGTSWRDSGASMADPIPKNADDIKGVLVDGDDGSRNLYTFDMTQSPNLVRRIVLLDANGAPVVNSPTVIARELEVRQSGSGSQSEDSSLTLDNWPAYNATLAPTEVRSKYAAASDGNGLVVFSGGSHEEEHVLCLFDTRGNSWVNATSKFSQQRVLSDDDFSTVSSTTSSATAARSISGTASSSSTSEATDAAAAGGGSNTTNLTSNTILGIVLGSIVGVMVLLGLILFLVRRRQARQNHVEAGHARRASGAPGMEKDDMAFAADFGASSKGHFRGHQPQDSAGSYSSMAILMGRVGQQNSKGLKRKPSNDTTRSSTSSMFNREFKSTISKPIPQQIGQHSALQSQPPLLPPPQQQQSQLQPAGDRITTFGATLTAKAIPPPRPPRGNATLDRAGSTRRSSGWNRYWSGGSALNILGFGSSKRVTVDSDQSSRYSDNRITQDSATVPPLNFEGKPELNRVNSGSPTVAQYPNKIPMREGMRGKIERPISTASSGYSSGIPASVHDTWDPLSAKKPWGSDRAPSSAYSGSAQGYYKASALDPGSTSARGAPLGLSTQPQLAMASTSSDMSWLNLGENKGRS